MTEIRRSKRVYSLLKAKIIFDDNQPSIDCIVNNISGTGAKIAVGNPLALPNDFNLEIPMRGQTYRAQVRWRDRDAVGLEFIEALAEARLAGEAGRIRADIARLENEIASLKVKLEALGARGAIHTAQSPSMVTKRRPRPSRRGDLVAGGRGIIGKPCIAIGRQIVSALP